MGKIFDMDGPLFSFLSRVADLMILNFLTVLLCLPVITAGASLSAMHYVLLKMARREEGHIARTFFKAFRDNFAKGTILWLILLAAALLFGLDLFFMNTGLFPGFMKYVFAAAGFLLFMVSRYIFPLQAHFENTIRATLSTAVLMAVAVGFLIPVLITYGQTGLVPRFPTLIACGFVGIAALMSFFTGLMLKTIYLKNRQDFEIDLYRATEDLQRKLREG